MVSAIYVCHWPDVDDDFLRCELLIYREYHNSVPSAPVIIDTYSRHYRQLVPYQRAPVLYHQGINYISYWGDGDILLLAISQANCSPMLTVLLLHKFFRNIVHYFEVLIQKLERAGDAPVCKVFSRDSIVDNYSLIYELLDECVDFGVVQVTDFGILKEYIRMEINHGLLHSENSSDSDLHSDPDLVVSNASSRKTSHKQKRAQPKPNVKSTHNRAVRTDVVNDRVTDSINSSMIRTQVLAISWRPKGIFYPKNEIYVDVIETCEFLYDLESKQVKANQVLGNCMVRSYLSGMPVCKLGLNEKYISRIEYDEEELNPPTHSGDVRSFLDNQLQNDSAEEADPSEAVSGTPRTPDHGKKKRVPITNVLFHLCIELSRIYKENLIFFTPPDEEFQLFSYRVEQEKRKSKSPLLLVDPTYRILKHEKKLHVMCSILTNFKKKLHAQRTVVTMPIDASLFEISNTDASCFRFKCEMGEVRFKVDTSEIVWAIGDLPGSKKVVRMMAEVSLRSCEELDAEAIKISLGHSQAPAPMTGIGPHSDEALSDLDRYYGVAGAQTSLFAQLQRSAAAQKHYVSISFQIPMLTYSGLKIIYLRVDEETMKYTCFPWVRYVTQAQNGQEKGSGQALGSYRFKLGPSNFNVV